MSDLAAAVLGPEPTASLATAFLAANAVAAGAVLAVAPGRLIVRRMFGPAAACSLWSIPPLAALASVLVTLSPPAGDVLSPAAAIAGGLPKPGLLLAVWASGAIVLAAAFVAAQARFLAEVRAGRGGPAVVGLISPRIVLPAHHGYTPEERELIRAHERAHVARKDPRAAALAALFQCLCWFNPLAHLAAYLLRLDQELACDAAVVLRRPNARALYAKTLLKTQLAATPLPFGCYWPARSRHPLEVRIALLKPAANKGRPSGTSVVLASIEPIRP
ncbi:MAG: peptidase M56 [Phenylobacterium sp.]|uniref:M56 family metallopeptidase n=1 Tax=Phenylobacterium sp. TaxID=1871053 RepID=UPI001A4AA0FB|nr:M56 family metallopeptidase [Phenylobacterium sp.]MBL8553539.1 peptidase M56 [Phenylobacterium sp.]